jgi:hypothetical protein
MYGYLYRFVAFVCAVLWHAHVVPGGHRDGEIRAILRDILTTDASVDEALQLALIPALESGYERSAVGKAGERGAWQAMTGDTSARHALYLLRSQGMLGYVGCVRETEECMRLVANRTLLARIWAVTFPFSEDSRTALSLASPRGAE